MNRQSRKQRESKAKELFKKPKTPLLPIDLKSATFIPSGMTRAFGNNRYVVMIFDNIEVTSGTAIRVLIQKHDNKPIDNHWSEIQSIKNEIFGPEIAAVEYYPKESELINDKNIYWIWIYPEGVLPKPIMKTNH